MTVKTGEPRPAQQQPSAARADWSESRPLPPSSPASVAQAMADLYDHYFSVRDYARRYPQPNALTLEFLMAHGADQARHVLDFGCGNGRYALALLERSQARITGYDISAAALAEFRESLVATRHAARVQMVHGGLGALGTQQRFDMALILFGVLSHVGDRAARLAALRKVRELMLPGGRLILSVPCQWRRRPIEALTAAVRRWTGQAPGLQAEPGNIVFARELGGKRCEFFYHLYSLGQLRAELRDAGFEMDRVASESVLPEWMVTQHPRLGRWDSRLARHLPAHLGYGILASARPL